MFTGIIKKKLSKYLFLFVISRKNVFSKGCVNSKLPFLVITNRDATGIFGCGCPGGICVGTFIFGLFGLAFIWFSILLFNL